MVTGATGTVGVEVMEHLLRHAREHKIIAAVREPEKAQALFGKHPSVVYRKLDMEATEAHLDALQDVDRLFLLRPPQLSNIDRVFGPLLTAARAAGLRDVVFLSVQGAEKQPMIPHRKIERLLQHRGFRYVFLRPGYFMQNLTTSLLPEIRHHSTITLPAGKALFNWIDARDIGRVAATILLDFEAHANQAYTLTAREQRSFHEVADMLSEISGRSIRYIPVGWLRYYRKVRREGASGAYASVLTALHAAPRWLGTPPWSHDLTRLLAEPPTSLREFLHREKSMFNQASVHGNTEGVHR